MNSEFAGKKHIEQTIDELDSLIRKKLKEIEAIQIVINMLKEETGEAVHVPPVEPDTQPETPRKKIRSTKEGRRNLPKNIYLKKGKYTVSVSVRGKLITVGTFKELDEAITARDEYKAGLKRVQQRKNVLADSPPTLTLPHTTISVQTSGCDCIECGAHFDLKPFRCDKCGSTSFEEIKSRTIVQN